MDETVIEKIKQMGFNVTRDRYRKEELRVHSSIVPSKETIIALIELLTEKEEICYWNAFHRTISDPGAYVYVLHTTYFLAYMEGNHGWSSDWKRVSIDSMALRIIGNWNQDCDRGKYLNAIYIKPTIPGYANRVYEQLQREGKE